MLKQKTPSSFGRFFCLWMKKTALELVEVSFPPAEMVAGGFIRAEIPVPAAS
jgi:hypothetical protein